MKAFLASKLSNEQAQVLNRRINYICLRLGVELYMAQIELPLGTEKSPLEILEINERAIDETELGIIVFDDVGCGTAIEYERAYVRGKKIVGYRSKESMAGEYLGQMMEGAWQRLEKDMKANSLDELEKILERLVSEYSLLLINISKSKGL